MSINGQIAELHEMKQAAPLIRLWNGNMEFLCGIGDDIPASFEYKCNETGVGTVTLRQGSYAFSAVTDQLYAGSYEALIITVDPVGVGEEHRWSGMLDNYELTIGEEGFTELKLTFLNDFEYIKRTIVPNISFLPSFWPFQPQKRWAMGPSTWLVGFMCGIGLFSGFSGVSNIWQRWKSVVSLNGGTLNAFSVVEAFTQFIFKEQRDYYINAPSFLQALSTGARWRQCEGDYSTIYDTVKDLLDFDNVVITVHRYVDGDMMVGSGSGSGLKHGCLVVDIVRKPLPSRAVQLGGVVNDTGNTEGASFISTTLGSLWFTGREVIDATLGMFSIYRDNDVVSVQLSNNYSGEIDGSLERLADVKTYPGVVFESRVTGKEVSKFSLKKSTPKSVSVFTKGNIDSPMKVIYATIRLVYDTIGQMLFLIPLGGLFVDLVEPLLQRFSNPRPRWSFQDRKYYYSPTLYPTAFQPLDGMLFGVQQASNRRKAFLETSEASSHSFSVTNSPFAPFWHFGLGTSVGCEIVLDDSAVSNKLVDGHLWLGRVDAVKIVNQPKNHEGIYEITVKTDTSKRGREFNEMMVSQINTMTRALKRALLL